MTSSQQAQQVARRITDVLLRTVNRPAWQFAVRELPLAFWGDAQAVRVLLEDFALAVDAGRRAPADGALKPQLEAFVDAWVERLALLVDAHGGSAAELEYVASRLERYLDHGEAGPPTHGSPPPDPSDFEFGPPPGGEFPTEP